jgi:hypothetical protein
MVCQPDTALVDQLPDWLVISCAVALLAARYFDVAANQLQRRVDQRHPRHQGKPTTSTRNPLREYDKANLNLVRGHRVRLQV